MLPDDKLLLLKARVLLDRLERLSADSSFAHRASGIRGAILRQLAAIEGEDIRFDRTKFNQFVEQGYQILTRAAQEIPEGDPD